MDLAPDQNANVDVADLLVRAHLQVIGSADSTGTFGHAL